MTRAQWLKVRPAKDKYGRPWLPEDIVQQFRKDNEKRRKQLTAEHEALKKFHEKYKPPDFASSKFNFDSGFYGNLDPIDITDKQLTNKEYRSLKSYAVVKFMEKIDPGYKSLSFEDKIRHLKIMLIDDLDMQPLVSKASNSDWASIIHHINGQAFGQTQPFPV